MKAKDFPFYPLIVAVIPAIATYAANLAYVPGSQLVRPLVVLVLLATALTGLFSLVFRNVAKGAAVATTLFLFLYAFAWMQHTLPWLLTSRPRIVWAFLTLAFLGLAAWKAPAVRGPNVIGACLFAVVAGNAVFASVRGNDGSSYEGRVASVGSKAADKRPDIYYIVLDGHGREDSLRRAIGYDDHWFVQGLRDRGFYVADESLSNYCQTELSIPSSLNMGYISDLLPKVKPSENDRTVLSNLIDDNTVARRLRGYGYRIVGVTSGFPPVRFTTADAQYGDSLGLSFFEMELFRMTPVSPDLFAGSLEDTRRKTLREAFSNLSKVTEGSAKPCFIEAHIFAPHPPYVFDSEGKPYSQGAYGVWDADAFLDNVGSRDAYRKGYQGQATYIDTLTLATIDRLLAAKSPRGRPIIIIQGDHGSRVNGSLLSAEKADVNECFPIINALLVPDAVRKALRPDITPVNTFRILFNGLFGERNAMIPNHQFFNTSDRPFEFTEVTNRIAKRSDRVTGEESNTKEDRLPHAAVATP